LISPSITTPFPIQDKTTFTKFQKNFSHLFTMSNPGNIVGGHKANLNNPSKSTCDLRFSYVANACIDTSEESKQHSKEVLDNEFNGGDVGTGDANKNPNNVVGGLKA